MRFTLEQIEAALGAPLRAFERQCHAASLAIVKSDLLPEARVARGLAKGLVSQHSWVMVGDDCYDMDALIIDPTLWSYRDDISGVWYGTYRDGVHEPHGRGRIQQYGRPPPPVEEAIEIDKSDLSEGAKAFLTIVGPLDLKGWIALVHSPVEGWPAQEILTVLNRDPRFSAFIPIDILGMVTDANPHGLYLRGQ